MSQDNRTWHDLRLVLTELPDLEMGQLQWMTWDGSALLLRIGIMARNSVRPRIDDRFNRPTEIPLPGLRSGVSFAFVGKVRRPALRDREPEVQAGFAPVSEFRRPGSYCPIGGV